MSDFITTLQEQRANLWERAKEIMDAAAGEKRDLTAEEDTNLAGIDANLAALDARIKATQERYAAAEAADAIRVEVAPVLHAAGLKDTDQSIVRAVLAHGDTRESQPSMDHRALAKATATVAVSFYDKVMVYARTLNPMLQVATVLNTAGGETLTMPRLTADTTTERVGESGTITPADPTIGSVNLGAFGYKSITLWSRELAQDASVDIDGLVAQAAARDIGINTGSDFTVGAGTTVPFGFVTRASSAVTGTAAGYFSADDLITAYYALAAPDRVGAAWMASTTGLALLRKKKDGDSTYLFNIGVGTPDSVLGLPVYENPAMATIASGSKSVAVGNFAKYYIRIAGGLRVERSLDAYFATDQVAIKTVLRADGDLIDTAAIKVITSYTS